jgi:hypothetical protein
MSFRLESVAGDGFETILWTVSRTVQARCGQDEVVRRHRGMEELMSVAIPLSPSPQEGYAFSRKRADPPTLTGRYFRFAKVTPTLPTLPCNIGGYQFRTFVRNQVCVRPRAPLQLIDTVLAIRRRGNRSSFPGSNVILPHLTSSPQGGRGTPSRDKTSTLAKGASADRLFYHASKLQAHSHLPTTCIPIRVRSECV